MWILVTLVSLYSCMNRTTSEKKPDSHSVSGNVFVPAFNKDSAYYYVEKQVLFGPRVPGSQPHIQCAEWLTSTMQRFADTTIVQHFRARNYSDVMLEGRNIIGIFNADHKRRILLCAHWDSRHIADHDPDPANRNKPVLGANDGASGVGVLLEVARQLKEYPPKVGIDIILFDLEDYGPPQEKQTRETSDLWCLGSQYWARNPHIPGYSANFGILLDMVGAYNAQFPLEGFSMYYAPDIKNKIWRLAAKLGYGNYFLFDQGSYITDDHYYINKIARIPTINIIHLDSNSSNGTFFEYWHTVNDTMENIDRNVLHIVGDVVLNVIYRGI